EPRDIRVAAAQHRTDLSQGGRAQSEAVGRGWRSVTDLTTERVTDGPGPGDPSDAPFPTPRPPADPPFAPAGGVELSRLLALARLPPAQALEIGASVLAAAAQP